MLYVYDVILGNSQHNVKLMANYTIGSPTMHESILYK